MWTKIADISSIWDKILEFGLFCSWVLVFFSPGVLKMSKKQACTRGLRIFVSDKNFRRQPESHVRRKFSRKIFGMERTRGYQEFSEKRLKYRTYLECVCTVTFCHGPEILDHCLCYHGRGGAFSTRLRRCRRWGGWIWGCCCQVGLGQPSLCEVKQLNRLGWLRTFPPAAVIRSSKVIFSTVLIWGSRKVKKSSKTFSFCKI